VPAALLRRIKPYELALLAAIASGIALGLLWLVFSMARGFRDPFPTFPDGGLDGAERWTWLALGAVWLNCAVFSFRRAIRARVAGNGVVVGMGMAALLTLVAGLGWMLGLRLINAKLGLGRTAPTEIFVQRAWGSSSRHRGHTYSSSLAEVNRVDHPGETVRLSGWPGCGSFSGGRAASPFVTLMMGQGALGVPWYASRVCRPLAIDDVPLFEQVRIGRGRPLLIVAVWTSRAALAKTAGEREVGHRLLSTLAALAEGRRLPFSARLEALPPESRALAERMDLGAASDVTMTPVEQATWALSDARQVLRDDEQKELRGILAALEGASPPQQRVVGQRALAAAQRAVDAHDPPRAIETWLGGVPHDGVDVVLVGSTEAPSAERFAPSCTRCRRVAYWQLDERIYHLFLAGLDADHVQQQTIVLADARGQRVFVADLDDITRLPGLKQQIAATAAP
jgi:hypothetical protein